jgi:hypothetical protein
MRRWWVPLTLVTLVLPLTPPAAVACPIDTLTWLAGSWSVTKGEVREEEHWMSPRAGIMVGMNRIASGQKKNSFEFFRIEQREDGVYYVSSPGGRPPTPFKLKECGPSRVVFEKPDHDFPQRIIYRRDHPDTLHARIEGTMKGSFRAADWTWTRGALAP